MLKKLFSIILVILIVLLPIFTFHPFAYSNYAYSMGGEFFLPSNGYNYEDIIQACDYWALCGYHSYYTAHPTKSYVTQSKLNSDIIYFSCHGNQHLLSLLNSNLTINDTNTNTSNILGLGNITFTNNKLVIYDACSTAKTTSSDTNNLCKYTLNRGAECVLGWYVDISTASIQWQQKFQDHLALGYTINSSINYADSFTYTDTTLKSHRVYGSKDVAVKQSSNTYISDDRYIEIPKLEMEYSSVNKTKIIDYIGQYIKKYDIYDYTFILTSTSEDNSNYVVDLIMSIEGIQTPYGYTMIFENSCCNGIYDNTNGNEITAKPMKVTEDTINMYKDKSIEKAKNKSYEIDNIIANHNIIFDPQTGYTYIDVYVKYIVSENGAVGNEKYTYKI